MYVDENQIDIRILISKLDTRIKRGSDFKVKAKIQTGAQEVLCRGGC